MPWNQTNQIVFGTASSPVIAGSFTVPIFADAGQATEGEGFEPSIRLTTDNGFRDRRIRPLCHPSELRPASRALTEKEGFEPSREVFTPLTP